MSCGDFRGSWEPGSAEHHAAACPACAEWLARQRRVASALTQLAAGLDAAVRPAQRERELRAAFRAAQSPSPALTRRDHWPLAVVSTAACLAAVVVAFALRAPVATAPATAPPKAASSVPAPAPVKAASARSTPAPQVSRPRPVTTPAPVAPPPREEPAAAFLSPAETAPLHPAQVAEAPLLEAGADDPDAFYPLPPDAPRAVLDSGQIVRVQLRPDVLESAGLPRRAVPTQGPVEAEVLVGPDGVARGIRLAKPAATVGRER